MREIKSGKEGMITQVTQHGAAEVKSTKLLSFLRQPVDVDHSGYYTQAVVRFHYAAGAVEDVFIVSKAWVKPIRWTIEAIR